MTAASSRGFTLLEALIASLVVATAAVSLSQLIVVAAAQSRAARDHTTALTLAQGKLEELHSVPWSFAADGAPTSDAQLSPSPPGALLASAPGYSDVVDRFERRWMVAPLDAAHPDTLALHVCVFAAGAGASSAAAASCVATLRIRRP
jgi:Tfp pilus assembly protein PilV